MARRRRGRTLLMVAAGAAAQYFMDPQRGPGRRQRIREQVTALLPRRNQGEDRAVEPLSSTTTGTTAGTTTGMNGSTTGTTSTAPGTPSTAAGTTSTPSSSPTDTSATVSQDGPVDTPPVVGGPGPQ